MVTPPTWLVFAWVIHEVISLVIKARIGWLLSHALSFLHGQVYGTCLGAQLLIIAAQHTAGLLQVKETFLSSR